jgi:hypothetical protein
MMKLVTFRNVANAPNKISIMKHIMYHVASWAGIARRYSESVRLDVRRI